MNDKTMREAFERHIQESWAVDFDLSRDENGDYQNHTAQVAWVAVKWQSQQAQGDNTKPIADAVKHLNDWLSMDLCECEGPGHSCGATQIRNTIEGLEKLLSAPPAPAAVPTKRKAGFLMTDRNGKEHFISINRTCENADDLHGWNPVYFGDEDCSPQHEPAVAPECRHFSNSDEAREFLVSACNPEYRRYISDRRQLAGDFACHIATMLSAAPTPTEPHDEQQSKIESLEMDLAIAQHQLRVLPQLLGDGDAAAVPEECWDYDNLFYAISKATKALNGGVVITVKGFKEAMRECIENTPAEPDSEE